MPPTNPNSITSILQSIDPDEYSTLFPPPERPIVRPSPPFEGYTRRRLQPSGDNASHWEERRPRRFYIRNQPQGEAITQEPDQREHPEARRLLGEHRRRHSEAFREAQQQRDARHLAPGPSTSSESQTDENNEDPATDWSTSSSVLAAEELAQSESDFEDAFTRIRADYSRARRQAAVTQTGSLGTEVSPRADSDATAMPPRRSASTTAVNGATATSSRSSRRRTAAQAFGDEGSEADHEENINPIAGPRRRRRNDSNTNGQASSLHTNEPIVIDDLDDEAGADGEDTTAQRLQETLQKQREEAVKSQQAASEMPKLSKLQCVICMDSFTDMTATSCGHIFCHECLISALRASENRRFAATGVHGKRSQCPVCRTSLSRSKAGDLIPLLIMKKGLATQPRRARAG